jgi:hypothetical protein
MTEQCQDGHDGAFKPKARRGSMHVCPISLRDAQAFIGANHRHADPSKWHKFSLGIEEDGLLIGVVTAGRPIARANDDKYTLEITRCCVLEGRPNANSKAYGAALRAARAMGYRTGDYVFPATGKRSKPAGCRFQA